MAVFKKTVAETSVTEAMRLIDTSLEQLTFFEGALNIRLYTVRDAFTKHDDIKLLRDLMQHAE